MWVITIGRNVTHRSKSVKKRTVIAIAAKRYDWLNGVFKMELDSCCGTTCNKQIARQEHLALLAERDDLSANLGQSEQMVALLREQLEEAEAESGALAAQVEAMKNGIHHFNRTHGDLNPLFKAAFDSTPAACLAQVKADAVLGVLKFDGENAFSSDGHIYVSTVHRYAEQVRRGGTK
jgi:hypothetical protein